MNLSTSLIYVLGIWGKTALIDLIELNELIPLVELIKLYQSTSTIYVWGVLRTPS